MIFNRKSKASVVVLLISAISTSLAFAVEPTFEQRIEFRLKKMPERLQATGNSAVFSPKSVDSIDKASARDIPNDSYFSFISEKKDNIVIGSMAGSNQRIRHKYLAQPNTPLYAYSVTKFIVGYLVAEQVCDGKMSLGDKAGNLSHRLKGTAYENVSLSSILGMYSGVHSDADDFVSNGLTKNNQSYREVVYQGIPMYEQLKTKLTPDTDPDTHWQYSNFDSNALAVILSDQLEQSMAEFFKERIWNHIDPQYFGYWEIDRAGEAMGGYGLSLTATDWLKVGRHVASKIGNSECLRNHYLGIGYDTYKNDHAVWVNHSWANPDNRLQFGGIGYDGQILVLDIDSGNVVFIYSNKHDGYDGHISEVSWKLLSELNLSSQ